MKLWPMIFIACGSTVTTPIPNDAATSPPRDAAPPRTDASGPRTGCSGSGECASGTVCCAEVVEGDAPSLLTSCLPSCITGVPRARICASTAECADCAPFTCRGLPTAKYCGRPEFCPL
jgi:hypothetical protein